MISFCSFVNKVTQPGGLIFLLILMGCCLCLTAPGKTVTKPNHAIYLSMTEIELRPGEKGVIQIKVFSDDLQNALKNYSHTYQSAGLNQYFEKNRGLAERYFQTHFRLSMNQKKVDFWLSDFRIENDAHFITFHFKAIPNLTTISLEADFFMELFPTQTNVVKVNREGNNPYFFKFTRPTRPEVLTWTR